MKPGMPLLFGALGSAHCLGLPGNPVSVLATWLTLGRALLDGMQGRAEPRRAGCPQWPPISTSATRVGSSCAAACTWRRCRPAGRAESADGSLGSRPPRDSDVLIVLPEDERLFDAGDVVEVLPY